MSREIFEAVSSQLEAVLWGAERAVCEIIGAGSAVLLAATAHISIHAREASEAAAVRVPEAAGAMAQLSGYTSAAGAAAARGMLIAR